MKQKILIISSNIPYPLTHGGAIAQYYFLEKLSGIFDIFFSTVIYTKSHEKAIKKLIEALPEIKVLPFLHFNPKTTKDKVFQQARVFSHFLHELFVKVKTEDFKNIIYPVQLYSREYLQFVTEVIKKEEIKIVQLEFFDTLSLLEALPEDVKKIAVIHEVRSKRLLSAAKNSEVLEAYKRYVINCFKLIEDNLLKKADEVIVFNEDDKNLLSLINNNVTISPYGIPEKLIIKNKVSETFEHFLFIGGQNHDPNRVGLEWFLKEIYIAHYNAMQLPLYVVGKWDDTFREKYKRYTKIIFTGIVEDLDQWYEKAIMVTPIINGSGLRTKILHAFANKIPVMTTTFASEGLLNEVHANPHLILFDDSAAFITQAEEFLKHPHKLQEVAEEGFSYYEKNFSDNILVNKRRNVLLQKHDEIYTA